LYKLLKKYLASKAGKKKNQQLFEDLYAISLRGMNIGGGDETGASGEDKAIVYISKQLDRLNKLVVFDVGANIGSYSILLNNTLGVKAEIFSFEPSATTYKKLFSNTAALSNVKSFNFGFGEDKAVLPLFSDANESGLASLYDRRLSHFNIQMDKREDIEITTIDNFCLENNIAHIHFLKLDVEGHELKVLKGAGKMIASKNVDFIQFEFGGCNIDSRTFFQDFFYLFKNDFILYRIVKDGLYKIENYKEMYEAFATTNYLAERKTI
jgi:FkbM family methyltransferase